MEQQKDQKEEMKQIALPYQEAPKRPQTKCSVCGECTAHAAWSGNFIIQANKWNS